jgi:hypothetical protein
MSFGAVAAWARQESASLEALTGGMGRLTAATTRAANAPGPRTVVIGVGQGASRDAEMLTAFFTRLEPGGVGSYNATQARLAIEHVTQQHPSAGFSAADRALADIYTSIFTLTRYAPPAARGWRG